MSAAKKRKEPKPESALVFTKDRFTTVLVIVAFSVGAVVIFASIVMLLAMSMLNR